MHTKTPRDLDLGDTRRVQLAHLGGLIARRGLPSLVFALCLRPCNADTLAFQHVVAGSPHRARPCRFCGRGSGTWVAMTKSARATPPGTIPNRRGTEPPPPPTLIKPQLAKLVENAPDGPDWLHEIKFDGYRMHVRLERRESTNPDPPRQRLDR